MMTCLKPILLPAYDPCTEGPKQSFLPPPPTQVSPSWLFSLFTLCLLSCCGHVFVTFCLWARLSNMNTQITRTLWHVPLVSLLIGFYCNLYNYFSTTNHRAIGPYIIFSCQAAQWLASFSTCKSSKEWESYLNVLLAGLACIVRCRVARIILSVEIEPLGYFKQQSLKTGPLYLGCAYVLWNDCKHSMTPIRVKKLWRWFSRGQCGEVKIYLIG